MCCVSVQGIEQARKPTAGYSRELKEGHPRRRSDVRPPHSYLITNLQVRLKKLTSRLPCNKAPKVWSCQVEYRLPDLIRHTTNNINMFM